MAIGHTIHGGGPEGVIVLHGWFGGPPPFAPMFDYLDTDTFTYAFMDYRGYGKSIDVAGEYTIAEIAADAVGLADDKGWERFHVIGHSMGGMAVQRLALDVPERVKSVVALTPVPACGVPFDDDTWGLFSAAVDSDEHRRIIVSFSVGDRLCDRWVDRMVRGSRETSTVEAFGAYLPAWVRNDFAAEANGLKTPMLVVVGEHDGALTEDFMCQTFLEWYPNARLEVMANAGHYPMDETPVCLATMVEAFLKENA